MLVALTGASGLVGSSIAESAHRAGHRVRALVKPTSRRDHINAFVHEWTVGEHHDPQMIASFVQGVDAVVHNSVDHTAIAESPTANIEKNLLASLQLLEASRQASVTQFIFVSTVNVYHEMLDDRSVDEKHPTWPGTLYGAYKAAVEAHLKAYHATFGMNTSSWRPAAVYGLHPIIEKSYWFDLVRSVKNHDAISTARTGKIVSVKDVADAIGFALGDSSVAGHFFNLVDMYIHWQTVARITKELAGSRSIIENCKVIDPKKSFDNSKAVQFFSDRQNSVALRRGLAGVRECVASMLTHCGT